MRVLVCGGRDFASVGFLWATLDRFHKLHGIRVLIDGASDDVTGPYVGADYWANQWALARDVDPIRFHADWTSQGRAAGPIRNQRMLVEGEPNALIAFKGGRGTADMMRKARAANLKHIVDMTEIV